MSDARQRNYHEERSKIRKDVSLSEELKKIGVTSIDKERDRLGDGAVEMSRSHIILTFLSC